MLAGATAWAGAAPETATYVDGNLTGVAPNTGGTLSFDDDHAMTLHTGLTSIAIPYSAISHAELGAVKETTHNAPFYKVWELPKRLSAKPQTQLLIVSFKNDDGEQKNVTLELAKDSAQSTLSKIQNHGKDMTAAANDEWWGDKYWKTPSNQDKWNKPASTADRQ